jgi:hypothetical protein
MWAKGELVVETVIDFFRQRGFSLALVVLVALLVAVAESAISYTFALGDLQGRRVIHSSALAALGQFVRTGIVVLMATLWLLGRKRALFKLVIIANVIATLVLLIHTIFLSMAVAGLSFRAVDELLEDVVLMAIVNILIFSVWYWIIDPPGVDGKNGENEPWAFLFPQRGGTLPHYETWEPRYLDYLFLAFTTSFAFSPTDTLPLTRTAKMLMLLQSGISVVTLTGIAGSAINILAGGPPT